MTDTSNSEYVGCDLIDTYLNSVEQALMAAGAPRADRLQVLQNLESQISDMLSPHPLPFSEETVRSVIDKLEPPSHFARIYGNGKESKASPTAWAARIAQRQSFRWPFVAAVSCACLPVGSLLLLFAGAVRVRGPVVGVLVLMAFIGFVLTPFALWRAFKQLRAHQAELRGRDLVLKSTLVYAVLAPALVMGAFAIGTDGYALIPFGLAAVAYAQYVLVRRLHRRMTDLLPPQPAPDSAPHTAAPSVGTAMSMPAM